jgi:ribonuclease I
MGVARRWTISAPYRTVFHGLDNLVTEPRPACSRASFRVPATQRRSKGRRPRRSWAIVLAVLTWFWTQPAFAAPLAPTEHSDFSYYTFALTWQPGICATDEGCLADQPRSPLIGLHGLWASLPQTLIVEGIAPQQWWQRGCDYFQHSDAVPHLDPALSQRLDEVMPHFSHSLLTHEYDKHVQCFGFDPTQFFSTELVMRQALVHSAFGQYLLQHTGHDVAHTDVVNAFGSAFNTTSENSLQLQCGHDSSGRPILTQLWLTVEAHQLARFPNADSLINAPIAQDNCPAMFLLPDWPTPSR